MTPLERQLEEQLIEKLVSLKYEYRTDIRDRAALEKNFREKFEALIRVFRQTPRHGERTWALWLVEQDYVVILAERSGYYLLKTAFLVTKDHKREELERDWQASQPPTKS